MPRDLLAETQPAQGPRDLLGGEPPKPQSDFVRLFDEYRAGQMDPLKVPHFEELLKRKMPQMFHNTPVKPTSGSIGEVAENAIKAFPSSLVREGKNIVTALTSPIDTGTALIKTGAGGLSKLSPNNETRTEGDVENEQYWDAMINGFSERYGSMEGFLEAVQTEPASVLFDMSALLTAGGGALSKVPGMAKGAQIMSDIGKSLDPIQAAGTVAKTAGTAGAAAGAKVVEEGLGLTTGVGANTIKEAKGGTRNLFDTIEEGFTGKKAQNAGFDQARRGEISVNDIANRAKTAIADVREQRTQIFKDNLADLGNTPVVMDDVNEALAKGMQDLKVDITSKGTLDFSRVSPSSGTKSTAKNIIERVLQQGDKAGDLTPEGLLDLRDYLSSVASKDPKVMGLVDNLRKSIDDTLSQVPGYKELRTNADNYDSLIKEFEGTLGLTPNKSGHEIVRKLVAVSGDDIGLRRRLLQELETMADSSLAQEIAGLEMQRMLPKAMLTRAVAGGGIAYGVLANTPLLIGLAASSSPRLMGKLLYQYGYSRNTVKTVVEALKKSGAFDQKVTTTADIAGRANDKENTQ